MTRTEIFTMGMVTLAMGITGAKAFRESNWPLGAFCLGIVAVAWFARIVGTP